MLAILIVERKRSSLQLLTLFLELLASLCSMTEQNQFHVLSVDLRLLWIFTEKKVTFSQGKNVVNQKHQAWPTLTRKGFRWNHSAVFFPFKKKIFFLKKRFWVLILFFYCWYNFEWRENAREKQESRYWSTVYMKLVWHHFVNLNLTVYSGLSSKLLMEMTNTLESWEEENVILREVHACRKVGRETCLFGEQFSFCGVPAQLSLL